MKKHKRYTIGVMIHYLDNDYSKILLRGITSAAEEMDVNLVILPGRSLNCQLYDLKNTTYEYQYNTIYSFATPENLDALIVSAGTVGQFVTREEFKEFLSRYEGIPIITLENVVRGYPCIRLSGSGIKDMVNHLVTEHGKRNIAFVSSPKSNTDAEERLSYYREALEENGIEYNPELVAYGRFSEYCVELVGELLDRNKGKIDAICFANDMMCKGGYTAIAQRGLVIGKDIAVTGYDDSEIASALTPQLSTIRADASVLGERALKEAIKLAQGEKVDELINLGSTIVKRQSCGCDTFWDNLSGSRVDYIKSTPPEQLSAFVMNEYISARVSNPVLIRELEDTIAKFLEYTINMDENDPSDQREIFDSLLSVGLIKELSPSTFIDLLKSVRYIATVLCGDNHEKILAVHNVIEHGFDAVSDYLLFSNVNNINDLTFTHFLISNISKDMLVAENDEEKRYLSIVENLSRMHIRCCYIYTYNEIIVHSGKDDWIRPEHIYLRSYHDENEAVSVSPSKQKIKSVGCIKNKFMSDRRRTLILFPLFVNEENYGIMAAEPEFEYYPYIYSIAPQICTAIKLTDLVKQLENSLNAATFRNNQLSRISMHDELTGVFNRRGFYESANQIFTSAENAGKRCVLIFADLDNLKKINDTFGHEEGDYAIKSIANFLKSGLRNTDIVARIGGDEFAAFALCEDEKIIRSIPSRIKKIAEKHNLNSDKKYNITVSIGVYELNCNPAEKIQLYMDKADASLYEDKKNKNPDIFKNNN